MYETKHTNVAASLVT